MDNQNDQCEHQQNMDEPAQCVAADKAKQPKDEEDYKDCPEHFYLPKLYISLQQKLGRQAEHRRLFVKFKIWN